MPVGNRDDELRVATHSLQSADNCMQEMNYGRAFAHYLLVLKLMPEKKPHIKENFSLALKIFANELESEGRIDNMLKCYEQACELFPECETMLNNMGAQLFRLGHRDQAASCFRRALQLDPEFLQARDNLENICCHLVERWHFRMLNDVGRNQAFRSAICRAVAEGHKTVLDIGTGTGLLSMMAVDAGAERVYGCEMSKTMYEMSCDVLKANDMKEKVTMIHKQSTDLTIPEDITNKVSLVVTETFDSGLLGEHVMSTLHHAWKNLLLPDVYFDNEDRTIEMTVENPDDYGRVIPAGAVTYICGIECDAIRKENRPMYSALRNLDMSEASINCTTGLYWEDSTQFDPYTSEQLNTVRGGYTQLTDVAPTMDFNFNNPNMMPPVGVNMGMDIDLVIRQDGRLDALAMWFDLHLDKHTTLSSSPESDSCWEQAIHPVLPIHLLKENPNENFCLKKGDIISVQCMYIHGTLSFRCTQVERIGKKKVHSKTHSDGVNTDVLDRKHCPYVAHQKQSNANTSPEGTLQSRYSTLSKDTPQTSSSDDKKTKQETFCNVVSKDVDGDASVFIKNNPHQISQIQTECGCTGYSQNSKTEISRIEHSVNEKKCHGNCHRKGDESTTKSKELSTSDPSRKTEDIHSEDVYHESAFYLEREELCRLNDIDYNKAYCMALEKIKSDTAGTGDLTVLDITQGFSPIALQALKLGAKETCVRELCLENQELHRFLAKHNKIDEKDVSFMTGNWIDCTRRWGSVLVADMIEPCGVLHQDILHELFLARMASLKEDAITVPCRMTVHGMLIESDTLLRDSAVISDEQTLGYKIADFINVFQARNHVGIDLFTLPYKKLSEPFHLFTFCLYDPHDDSVVDYLQQATTTQVEAIDCGCVTAVVYWFDLTLVNGVKLCTLNKKSHWKQAAVIHRKKVEVSSNMTLRIDAQCKNSCIDVKVEKLKL